MNAKRILEQKNMKKYTSCGGNCRKFLPQREAKVTIKDLVVHCSLDTHCTLLHISLAWGLLAITTQTVGNRSGEEMRLTVHSEISNK